MLLMAASAGARAAPPPIMLSYDGTLSGVRMLHADIHLDLTGTGYTVRLKVISAGPLRVLARGDSDVISQGVWSGVDAVPTHVDAEGYWNGRPRRMIVDYTDGAPVIRVLLPPDRERVRALRRDEIAGTIDALGLIVATMRRMQLTGGCAQRHRVFDGHGVAEFTMTAAAADAVGPPAAAARCDFTTRKVAGIGPGDAPERVDHGYVLFAAPAGGLPVLPVRIVFQTRWTGDAVLALAGARIAPS